MYFSKKQTKNGIIIIALSLVLSMSIPLLTFPIVNAQTVKSIIRIFTLLPALNVVGVGQLVSLVTWTSDMPPDIGETVGNITSPSGKSWLV